MSNAIIVQQIGSKTIIRFNRPDIRSPLSIAVIEELTELMASTDGLPGVDEIVFTGVGDVFASGADLREIASIGANDAAEFARMGQHLMNRIAGCGVVTTAAINGFCFGGALDLALACTRRIASPAAVFSHPGVGLGIMTGWGGTQRLPRLVGEAKALEIFLTARRVSAAEALEIGLVAAVVEDPVMTVIEAQVR